jgi:hypothetical protein
VIGRRTPPHRIAGKLFEEMDFAAAMWAFGQVGTKLAMLGNAQGAIVIGYESIGGRAEHAEELLSEQPL